MSTLSGGLIAHAKPESAALSAVVTRADGRVENLGVVAYYHRNPIRRALWALGQRLKGKN